MSTNIVLSAAVRQNLLSLQSTAQLLATTQNDLATGNKVNSALDDPTSYFTAQGLNTRASNISNLLNGISNGVQVLQAANTGITSLQSLVQNAQSIANQALQAPIGYSTKSNYSTSIGGATSSDLRGNTTYSNAIANGIAIAGAATGTTTLSSLGITGTLTVDGKTINFAAGATPGAGSVPAGSGVTGNLVTDGNGNSTVYLGAGTVNDLLTAIDLATGTQTAGNANGSATLTVVGTKSTIGGNALAISTGTAADLDITGTVADLAALGLAGNQGTQSSFIAARTAAAGSLSGKTLTFTSFNGGNAVNVTFGDGTNGTVKSLSDLNAKLVGDNLTASIDTTGNLTISAANAYASSTLGGAAGGTIGGTAVTGSTLTWTTPAAPVADAASQTTRANLVIQYNNILDQINKTAQDASYNGINLLNGDQLQLVFDETGKSTLNITGTTDNANGLGLANLTQGTDFVDNNSTNQVLSALTTASSSLQSLASTLGSNLSVVQNRQTFNTSLINVLQTGASNLTIADPNELAAQSQALTTRQSIAVSALALANQNQQSVLQLLR